MTSFLSKFLHRTVYNFQSKLSIFTHQTVQNILHITNILYLYVYIKFIHFKNGQYPTVMYITAHVLYLNYRRLFNCWTVWL
jgi:hypothetical protein